MIILEYILACLSTFSTLKTNQRMFFNQCGFKWTRHRFILIWGYEHNNIDPSDGQGSS